MVYDSRQLCSAVKVSIVSKVKLTALRILTLLPTTAERALLLLLIVSMSFLWYLFDKFGCERRRRWDHSLSYTHTHTHTHTLVCLCSLPTFRQLSKLLTYLPNVYFYFTCEPVSTHHQLHCEGWMNDKWSEKKTVFCWGSSSLGNHGG
jgi:hypothetical protein